MPVRGPAGCPGAPPASSPAPLRARPQPRLAGPPPGSPCGPRPRPLLDLTGVGHATKWLWELNEDTDRPPALSIIATLGRLSFVVVVFRLMPLPSPLATEPG